MQLIKTSAFISYQLIKVQKIWVLTIIAPLIPKQSAQDGFLARLKVLKLERGLIWTLLVREF
jgi:hypothetical protein